MADDASRRYRGRDLSAGTGDPYPAYRGPAERRDYNAGPGRPGEGGREGARERRHYPGPAKSRGITGTGPRERHWWDRTADEMASWFGDEQAERRREIDEEREGRHRGRGPRGYTRSDERIREDVNDRLTDDPWLDASDIEVTVRGGEVTLDGTVESRADKRRAEDISDAVAGVTHTQNNLRIRPWAGAATGAPPPPAGT